MEESDLFEPLVSFPFIVRNIVQRKDVDKDSVMNVLVQIICGNGCGIIVSESGVSAGEDFAVIGRALVRVFPVAHILRFFVSAGHRIRITDSGSKRSAVPSGFILWTNHIT